MAVTALAVLVPTSAALLYRIPPGPCTVIVSNQSGHTVYLGNSNAVTTANGFPIPTGAPPLPIPGYAASAETDLWGISGTSSTIGLLVSTSH